MISGKQLLVSVSCDQPSCLWPHSGFSFSSDQWERTIDRSRSHLEAMRALHTSANDGTGCNWPQE
jgi:hypothetical protein